MSPLRFLGDPYVFPACHILLGVVFLYALRRYLRSRGKRGEVVKRGEESWSTLVLAYGVAAVLALQVVNASEAWRGYKVLASILDLLVLNYLFFYSGWFRNAVINVVVKAKQLEERC